MSASKVTDYTSMFETNFDLFYYSPSPVCGAVLVHTPGLVEYFPYYRG